MSPVPGTPHPQQLTGQQAVHGKIALPPLAFAAHSAWEETDAEIMSERLNRLGTARMDYRPRTAQDAFRSLSVARQIGSLLLSANSCSAVEYHASNVNTGILIIPLSGSGETVQEKRSIRWDAASGGAILSKADTVGFSTRRSLAGVSLDQAGLERLARHMLGHEGPAAVLDFDASRPLPYGRGRMRFDLLFRRLLAAIDGCIMEPAILERSGLDDAFNRGIVMWLRPDAFLTPRGKPAATRPGLDDACDYILANLDKKITLTQLEAISGLSPRVLQYAFQHRFGCSPMQWVKTRRLEAIRSQILSAPPGVNISHVATQYFSNLGEFAQKYKAHFGELPSETHAARKSR